MDPTFKLGKIKLIHSMLRYGLFTWKVNCYYSFRNVFIAVAINIHNKVSFNIECFKNFLPLSSIFFNYFWSAIKGSRLLKNINFDSGNYLKIWVTFDVFTCNRIIKLNIALKRSKLHSNMRWLIWKLEHLANTPWLATLMITVCWGNWNVSLHAGTFHMTCTVICWDNFRKMHLCR